METVKVDLPIYNLWISTLEHLPITHPDLEIIIYQMKRAKAA